MLRGEEVRRVGVTDDASAFVAIFKYGRVYAKTFDRASGAAEIEAEGGGNTRNGRLWFEERGHSFNRSFQFQGFPIIPFFDEGRRKRRTPSIDIRVHRRFARGTGSIKAQLRESQIS